MQYHRASFTDTSSSDGLWHNPKCLLHVPLCKISLKQLHSDQSNMWRANWNVYLICFLWLKDWPVWLAEFVSFSNLFCSRNCWPNLSRPKLNYQYNHNFSMFLWIIRVGAETFLGCPHSSIEPRYILGMSQLPPPLHVVPGPSCPACRTTEDISPPTTPGAKLISMWLCMNHTSE